MFFILLCKCICEAIIIIIIAPPTNAYTRLLAHIRNINRRIIHNYSLYIRVQLTPEVARRRKILRITFLHTSKSHSVAPSMQAYSARELAQKCSRLRLPCSCLLCIFFRGA